MKKGLSIHHLGILVEDLNTVTEFYINLFEMKEVFRRKAKYIKGQTNAEVVFLKKDGLILEFIGPLVLNDLINKTHLALNINDLHSFISKLTDKDIRFEKYLHEDGSLDLIKFNDPESNTIEMFEKSSSHV